MRAVDKWGLDKTTHFLVGALIVVLVYLASCTVGATQVASLAVGFGLSIVAGVAKELLDERFDWKDLLATAIGGAAAAIGLIVLCV